jgi:geranylgeranyl reductase family protein
MHILPLRFLPKEPSASEKVPLTMNYDIVVVGAGPAGATAAKFLAEKDAKVLLIDKHTFPRDKPCGGLITIRTLKRFPYISEEFISSYSFGGSLYSSSLRNRIQVQYNDPIAAFVVRKDFDYNLIKLALESGAIFRDGVSATNIQILNDKAAVTLETGESVESQLVIGADGVWSVIAKKSGLGQHYLHIGRCLYQEIPLTNDLLDEYFTEKKKFQLFIKFMGINGFGWIAPKNGCINIGIGEMQPSSSHQQIQPPLKEVYHDFIRVLKEQKLIPPTITSETFQGGALPLRPLEKTFADRVVLCGDAAGQMNPLTGDGIHYAMSSGMFAANVCAKAVEAGSTNASFLSKYQTLWKNDFGREIKIFNRVLKMLLKGNRNEKYIRLLSRDPQIFTMLFTIADTQGRIQDYQWKIARRFISLYIKDLLGF